jgi:mono/diheme cytochrome c family protein
MEKAASAAFFSKSRCAGLRPETNSMRRRLFIIAVLVSGLLVGFVRWSPILAQTSEPAANAPAANDASAEPRDEPPAIPPETLKDPAMIAQGEKLWQEQCTHCHGSKAYPGKAPKLQPRTYKPEFVWDRVHNGFRGMPSWKAVYEPNEVLALVAYVLSDDFFP